MDRQSMLDFSLKLYFLIIIIVGSATILVGLLKVSPIAYPPGSSSWDYNLWVVRNPNGDNQPLEKCPTEDPLSHFISLEKKLDMLSQQDKHLSHYVRVRYLTPPSGGPYPIENVKLAEGRNRTKNRFTDFVTSVFKKKGKFVDASGMTMAESLLSSATLPLEKDLGWDGLVIACNPFILPALKQHRRNAWIADVCLSRKDTPEKMVLTFDTSHYTSSKRNSGWQASFLQILSPKKESVSQTTREKAEVQMIPLFNLLDGLGWKEVDYLNVEMKGYEIDIVKNIPFDKVTFKLIQMGVLTYTDTELSVLDEIMRSNDYILVNKNKIMGTYRLYVHQSAEAIVYDNIQAYHKLIS